MPTLKTAILDRIRAAGAGKVWVPADFAALGTRDAIDKALQRMVAAGELRRIDRGLYDLPDVNSLTGQATTPDYRRVIDAIARRDQLRLLVDGMTAANDLGLTDAIPAKVTIHTDSRRRSLRFGNLMIELKVTAPSRLYWAGRPAMRVVQALHWLKDTLPGDQERILDRLAQILTDPRHGAAIGADLKEGFSMLPAWMQQLLMPLLGTSHLVRSGRASATSTLGDVPAKR